MSVKIVPVLLVITLWIVLRPQHVWAQNSPGNNSPSICASITEPEASNSCLSCIATGGIFVTNQSGDVFNPLSDSYSCRYEATSGNDQSSVCTAITDPVQNAFCLSCLAAGKNYNYDASGQYWCSLSEKPKLKNFDLCDQIGDTTLRQSCEVCGEEGDAIFTAFGCVSTQEEGFARDLINIILGLAGGVALLSILTGSLILSISQGDTNKVKQAKSLITASVSGLLFMIFSIIILRFIGVDILQIPGLN